MLINRIKTLFKSISVEQKPEYSRILKKIGREVSKVADSKKTGGRLKILYGPSFSIYPPCYVHDALFTAALRIRGADVIPIYCDCVQHTECNVYGGVWVLGGSFTEKCLQCDKTSQKLWKDVGLSPKPFSKYLAADDIRRIEELVESLPDGDWLSYSEKEMPFGHWAKDILINNYVVGDYHLIEGHEYLGRTHLRNLLVVYTAYEKILVEVKPDRVVCNDSYYGMWAILQNMCKRRNIPFYSHWSGTRPGAWCYAYNDASMNLDYGKAWPVFSAIPLTDDKRVKIDEWLEGRLSGKEMLIDTASLAPHCNEEADLSKIIEDKPTALLAANVIWDLAALNKQIVFDDMIDWIAETIAWFGAHSEYQLIVKPHPAEQNPSIPETVERVTTALMQRGVVIPGNVAMLTPKSAVTVYQLLPLVHVGIMHTTTVGFEMSARGIPVITTARSPYRGFGFTLDPATRDEYFVTLEKLLNGGISLERDKQIDLAYKFILFQHFHYYSKIDIMDFKWGGTPSLKVTSLDDMRPGRKPHFDYIVDSVVAGVPIVSEDRWSAES